MTFLEQVFTLLTTAPGSLVYHLVLVFSTLSAFGWAFAQWRTTEFPQAKRAVTGLLLILTAQAAIFVAGGLAWQGLIDANVFLPTFDRAVTVFCLVWIIWLWAYPEPLRNADAATMLLSFLVIVAMILGILIRQQQEANIPFNDTYQTLVWAGATLVIAIFGIIVLVTRRPNLWQNGLAMLILIATGQALDFIFPLAGGNYMGASRLFLMAAYPILLTLPQRFPTPFSLEAKRTSVVALGKDELGKIGDNQPIRERRRYSTDPKTLHALLNLAAETEPGKLNDHITRSVAQAMLSDLCFLIYITEGKQMVVATGYDLIREEKLDGAMLNKEAIPLLANAVLRGRPLRLPASSTSSDLKGLGDMLGLSSPGHLLNVPITSDKGHIGSLLLLSPYSNRLWSADDQTFLTSISTSFIPIVERGRHIAKVEEERDRIQRDLEDLQAERAQAESKLSELKVESDKSAESATRLAALTLAYEEAKNRLTTLEGENEAMRSGLPAITVAAPESEYLEKELRITLGEVARLQNTLAEANMKILELEKRTNRAVSSEQTEVIASISQELRQPMSSIIGYTDLLLGESVGILGALQRKFIERIKASTERIGSLIEDLIQITSIETGIMSLKPEPIDLNLIIDNAMAYTSSQLRERNIALRIDMPKAMEAIFADREALQQILIHLLQNAGAASPVEGSVTLRVRMEKEGSSDYVLIQVTDTGGGIPAEDLPRVFSRLYRADNVLIQGIGDTGVGLSIAKTLTEAQGGRIWVETSLGTGSSFSVLLPNLQPPGVEEDTLRESKGA
jgi:signal transduction histidine kinase/GAF domain-containing protein